MVGTDLAVEVARRLVVLRDRIGAAGGDPERVRVVAMTKGFGPEAVVAAMAAGLCDVGENYARELQDKAAALARLGEPAAGMRWHYLGAIQRNKVPALASLVSCWQTVAREVEGAAVARRRPGVEVLVEVAVTDDPNRNGCPPASVPDLVAALSAMDLAVRGLMVVAPPGPGAADAFRTVRALADQLGLPERSMGMTDDLEAAIAEGSTMIRVGRGLFGPRPVRVR